MAASNLTVRVATAVVAVPLLLGLIYKAPPVAFFAFVAVAVAVGAKELFAMTHPGDTVSHGVGVAMTIGVSAVVYFFGDDHRALLTALVAVPMLGPLLTLVRLGEISTAALRAVAMGFSPLFMGGSLALLARLRRDLGDDGPGFVVMTIMFAWFADTGGYFAGRFLGRHKLYERVSPKKTVEGALGGLAGAVVGALLASFWFLPVLPASRSVPLALVAAALGQAGDLAESLLKRSTGIKDSGAIVPGHGGLLDRVDALILTSTTVYLYTLWWGPTPSSLTTGAH